MTAAQQGPTLTVAALITDPEHRILLGRRAEDPLRGKWVLPGGAVRFGEQLDDALVRLLAAKTAIDAADHATFDIDGRAPWPYDIIEPPVHQVLLVRVAALRFGALGVRPGADLDQLEWCDVERIAELLAAGELTPTIRTVLRDHGMVR